MNDKKDITILRDLAKKYIQLCQDEKQQQCRSLWQKHNSLHKTTVPIYVRAFAWDEMPESKCQCTDKFFHPVETFLRQSIFRSKFNDDWIFEPWLTVSAIYITPSEEIWGGIWGMPVTWIGTGNGHGAKCWDPPIKSTEDVKNLIPPHHSIDETKTAIKFERIYELLNDIIPVILDRAPLYRMWNGDISTQLGQLRGIEQIMWDMIDRPKWLHELLAFMCDGIIRTHQEAEKAGDWKLFNHENQAITYANELPSPSADGVSVTRDKLWYFCASQELALVGPDMFNEFMLQYQIPIMKPFGLTAYGCCEDLTKKISLLKQIPNLRRIAVSPFANVEKCAIQIGDKYVLSYRPSPADMVAYEFNVEKIRKILIKDLEKCRGCHVDITLKDVETVQGDSERLVNWVKVARQVIDELEL